MKTTRLLFLGLFGFFSAFSGLKAQTVTTANITIVGNDSAVTPTVESRNTYVGYQAGKTSSTVNPYLQNTFIGCQSGKSITTGSSNTFLGYYSGQAATTSTYNTYLGNSSGSNNTGNYNTAVGNYSLQSGGNYVTAVGASAGNGNSGNNNVFLGYLSGASSTTVANENVLIGYRAGAAPVVGGTPTGSGNVLIGNNVGYNMGLSNKLFIDNSSTSTPLIWGDFANDQVKLNGKTGIGGVSSFPTTLGSSDISAFRLFVTGGILTDEVRIQLSSSGTWADYVFAKDYRLKPLAEVEKFIQEKGHLPNVPSEKQVKENGIALGEMVTIQQEKIEELTLYVIQLSKELEELKSQLKKD